MVEITYEENNVLRKMKSEILPTTRANDFPKYLEGLSETVMYGDNTALIISNNNIEQLEINAFMAFNMTKQYCNQNDLVLNENETFQLLHTANPNQLQRLPDHYSCHLQIPWCTVGQQHHLDSTCT
jgi:hypothetical protein